MPCPCPLLFPVPAEPDEAICIRQWDWSETSQTVSLFARSAGLVRALAKGAKRPKAPFSGGIELLTRAGIGVILRPNSDLALLTEWDLQETFPSLRRSLGAYHAGLFMADLVHHAVTDHDPHVNLYDALLASLRALDDDAVIPLTLLRFQWATLVGTGYKPVLDADARTGTPLAFTARPASYRFDPDLGGLVSDSAPGDAPSPAPGSQARPRHGAWRVRAATIDLIRRVASESANSGGRAPPAAHPVAHDPHSVDRANRLLAAYFRHILGREPRTFPLVFGRHLPR